MELLCSFLKRMVGGVRSDRYPQEKCQSQKGKSDCLELWTCSEEVGWETFHFYFMFCHCKAIFWGSSPCVCLNKIVQCSHRSHLFQVNFHEALVEEHQPIITQSRGPQKFSLSSSLLGKKGQSHDTTRGAADQGKEPSSDPHFSATTLSLSHAVEQSPRPGAVKEAPCGS